MSSIDEEVLFLKAAIFSLLLQIHTDECEWRGALMLMDQATKDMSGTSYHESVKMHIWLHKYVNPCMKYQEKEEKLCIGKFVMPCFPLQVFGETADTA